MLDVNAIDLHYGAAQALRAVSLKAEPGKVTCVLGRNGVGKTSLLRAIAGQHSISKGSIMLGEEDISKLRPYQRARRGVAIVPQGREIFPLLTVEENLETGFAPLKRDERNIPNDVFSLFPVLNSMLRRDAQAAGAGYVDTYAPSEGHDACSVPASRWIEPLLPASPAAPLHPNAAGVNANRARKPAPP